MVFYKGATPLEKAHRRTLVLGVLVEGVHENLGLTRVCYFVCFFTSLVAFQPNQSINELPSSLRHKPGSHHHHHHHPQSLMDDGERESSHAKGTVFLLEHQRTPIVDLIGWIYHDSVQTFEE